VELEGRGEGEGVKGDIEEGGHLFLHGLRSLAAAAARLGSKE